MAQILRPISDVSGDWDCSTGSDRYALINETTASDSDYISGSGVKNPQICQLSPGETPAVKTGHSLILRAKRSTTSGLCDMILKQGTTTIKSYPIYSSLTTNYRRISIAISEAEANNITDYTNLSVTFVQTSAGGTTYVSQCYLTIPDAPFVPSIGLEMGCSF